MDQFEKLAALIREKAGEKGILDLCELCVHGSRYEQECMDADYDCSSCQAEDCRCRSCTRCENFELEGEATSQSAALKAPPWGEPRYERRMSG